MVLNVLVKKWKYFSAWWGHIRNALTESMYVYVYIYMCKVLVLEKIF